jgi:hypothetical protein
MSKTSVQQPLAATPHRRLTQAELSEEARARFGDDPLAWAFRCPACGDVATLKDFQEAAGDTARAGQECIGRSLGALQKPPTNKRGCDWAAYGLFGGPWTIVFPAGGDQPGREVRSFPLAEVAS